MHYQVIIPFLQLILHFIIHSLLYYDLTLLLPNPKGGKGDYVTKALGNQTTIGSLKVYGCRPLRHIGIIPSRFTKFDPYPISGLPNRLELDRLSLGINLAHPHKGISERSRTRL